MIKRNNIKWVYDCLYYDIKCPKCGRKIHVCEEQQEPGFREKSYLYCPYEDCEWVDDKGTMIVDHICKKE